MQASTTRSAIDKKTGRQQVFVCLLLFPFVLFTLSGFTFFPNTAQTPKQATETTLPLTLQMSTKLTLSAADESCTDTIHVIQSTLSEIRIYFNVCSLEHLSALVQGADAGAAFLTFISIWCEECAPVAVGATAIAAMVTASIDYLQYASQGCGGVFLDIRLDGGIKFEPACDIQARRP